MTIDTDTTVGCTAFTNLGISYRRLHHWTNVGYLHAENPTPGSGTALRWPVAELHVAARMARLVAAGVTPEAAVRVARGAQLAPGITVTITTEETA